MTAGTVLAIQNGTTENKTINVSPEDIAYAKESLDKLGIEYKQDEDGFLIVKHYHPYYEDRDKIANIDENRLFKSIKAIEKYADFQYSQVTNLGNLESIGGDACFIESKVTSLGNLKSIEGDVYFDTSRITSLGNLKYIGGNAHFNGTRRITSLGNLEYIGGDARLHQSNLSSLGKLKYIGGYAWFGRSNITDLSSLEYIGGDVSFDQSSVKSLGNLKFIGGRVSLHKGKRIMSHSGPTTLYIATSNLSESDFDSIKSTDGKKVQFNKSL